MQQKLIIYLFSFFPENRGFALLNFSLSTLLFANAQPIDFIITKKDAPS